MNNNSGVKYAILGYSTINIGDDIQSYVTSTLLDIDYIIDRDDYDKVYDREGNLCELSEPVCLIMNGWFMHNVDYKTGHNNIKFPIKNKYIIPIYISTCLSKDVRLLYNKECIEHYREHAPILCRDSTTLEELIEKSVPAENFGCLTQLLDIDKVPDNEEHKEKYTNSTIYIDCRALYERRNKEDKSFYFEHYIHDLQNMNPKHRIDYAKDLLSKYKYAKKIYSSRLHAFLPCRAMGIDIDYVGDSNYRVKDLVIKEPDKLQLRSRFYEFLKTKGSR